MALEIIKQPNGRYAVWTTVCDNFIRFNDTRDEVITYFVERGGKLAYNDDPDLREIEKIERRRIGKLVDAIDDGTITTLRRWHTWKEALAWLDGDYNFAPGEGKKMAKLAVHADKSLDLSNQA